MKIEFSTEDFMNILSELNNKSFIQISNMEQSNEKWGLPIFTRLVFDTINDAWKSEAFKNAITKVKEYAKKKGYKIATAEEMKQGVPVLLQKMSTPDCIAKGTIAKSERPKIITCNGVTFATSTLTFKQRQQKAGKKTQKGILSFHAAGVGLSAASSAKAIGGAAAAMSMIGGPAAGSATLIGGTAGYITGVVVSTALDMLIGHFVAKALCHLGNGSGNGIQYAYVAFIRPDKKLVWHKFAYFYIGDEKDIENAKSKGQESLNLLYSTEEEDLVLGDGIDAGNTTTVVGEMSDSEAPETPTNDEPEVVDVGGEVDSLDTSNGDTVIEYESNGENATMTPAESEAAFESLLDPDSIYDDDIDSFLF